MIRVCLLCPRSGKISQFRTSLITFTTSTKTQARSDGASQKIRAVMSMLWKLGVQDYKTLP